MLTAEEIEIEAKNLCDAEAKGEQIGLLSLKYPKMNLDDAYAIQAAVVRRKLDAGRKIIGWKIGLTSKAMQYALNIDSPDSGVLFDDMMFDDGAIVPASRFIQPRVEAEVAFVMKSNLKGPGVTPFDVLDATAYVTPALEILDTRIRRMDNVTKRVRNVFDTISDNAANAGLATGGRAMRPDQVDMRWMGAIVARNAQIEETGLGAGVLNNPARSIAWLANRLSSYGYGIETDQIVLAGSFIRPIEARHGDTIVADFGAHGSISLHFE